MTQTLLIALFICISTAQNTRRSGFEWNYDGDLTLVLDFANEYVEDDSRFIIFGSYAAHLASDGMLPFNDIDIIHIRPNEIPPENQPLNLRNRTVVNYHGRNIDLKAGFIASMDDLLDAVNINAVAVAFEFEKLGRDDIRLVTSLKDPMFDEFMRERVLKIMNPQRATANDCIRLLAKAHRYYMDYMLDGISRQNCERPQILTLEEVNLLVASPQITDREFSNRAFTIEGSYVWAKSQSEAEACLESTDHMEDRQAGRRMLSWTPVHGYYKEGKGKCVTFSGADPSHMYFHGIGHDQCRLKCDYEPGCWGFSVSAWGNCLHWMQNDIKKGGASWGDAYCWIAVSVVDSSGYQGRRSLSSAQRSKLLVLKDRRVLRDSDAYTLSSGYYNVGQGKCVTNSGGDPSHSYLHGVGEQTCRSKCDEDSQCYGFSVSIYGNCLHWTTDDLQESGGPVWGGAKCWLAQTLVERGRRKN